MITESRSPADLSWRELYKTALSEADPQKLNEQIQRAECAIVLRARQLFSEPGDHIEEEYDLDDALYALQALRSCLHSRVRLANVA